MFSNKKGIALWFGIPAYMCWAGIAMVTAAVILTPSFRVKKAVEKCVASGETVEACKERVGAMSKSDILDYIRDKATGPATQNFHG